MDPDSLRALWQVVINFSPDAVMSMTHEELMTNLLYQLNQQQPLSSEDWLSIRSYLAQKELLIRELLTD